MNLRPSGYEPASASIRYSTAFHHSVTAAIPITNHQRILAIAIPMILSGITIPLAGMVDTAVMGHLDDTRYLAAVAVSASLFAFLFMVFNFLRMGVTGRAAQFFGSTDNAALARLLLQGLVIAIVIGVVLILLQSPLAQIGLSLMGASPLVEPEAARYFAIRTYGAPFLLGTYVLTGWLIGVQKPRLVLALLVVNNGMNALLDLLFVPGLGMRVEGVAMATVLAELSAFSFGCWLLLRHTQMLPSIRLVGRLFAPGEARQLFHLNRDLFLRTIALMVVFTFFTAQGARQADDILAANAILLNMFVLAAYGLDGFAYAAEALVGQALGGRNPAELRRVLRLTAFWSLLQAAAISFAFIVIGTWWIDLLTSLQTVRALARDYLPWVIVLPLVAFVAFWLDGVCVGATLGREMRNTMLLATTGFFIAWGVLLPLGNHGLWLAMLLFFALRGVLLGFRLRAHYSRWKQLR